MTTSQSWSRQFKGQRAFLAASLLIAPLTCVMRAAQDSTSPARVGSNSSGTSQAALETLVAELERARADQERRVRLLEATLAGRTSPSSPPPRELTPGVTIAGTLSKGAEPIAAASGRTAKSGATGAGPVRGEATTVTAGSGTAPGAAGTIAVTGGAVSGPAGGGASVGPISPAARGPGRDGLNLPKGALTPTLVAVTPNSGVSGARHLYVELTGRMTHFVQGTTKADFGPGITMSSLVTPTPTSAGAHLDIEASAATGPHKITLTTGTEVVTLPNSFSVMPNDTPETAPLIVSGSAAVAGAFNQFSFQRPPVAILANFHWPSDTSDWFIAHGSGSGTGQESLSKLRISISITGGPADGIYEIELGKITDYGPIKATVLRTSLQGHVPAVVYEWSERDVFLEKFLIEVRHISGAPSSQPYRLNVKLGD